MTVLLTERQGESFFHEVKETELRWGIFFLDRQSVDIRMSGLTGVSSCRALKWGLKA